MLVAIERRTQQLEADLFARLRAVDKQNLFDLLSKIISQQQITPGVHPAYRQMEKADGRTKRS